MSKTKEDVSYKGIHTWVGRNFGKPKKCEHCGKDNLKGREIHWASINGQYTRNRSDWIRLCIKCHAVLDKEQREAGVIKILLPDSKSKEYSKKYRLAHKNMLNEKSKEYRQKNPQTHKNMLELHRSSRKGIILSIDRRDKDML